MATFIVAAETHRQTERWGQVCDTFAAMAIELSRVVFRRYGVETAVKTTVCLLADLGGVWATPHVRQVERRMADAIREGDLVRLSIILRRYCHPASSLWGRLLLLGRYLLNAIVGSYG